MGPLTRLLSLLGWIHPVRKTRRIVVRKLTPRPLRKVKRSYNTARHPLGRVTRRF